MDSSKKWFTEECEECGTAFSFEIVEKIHAEQTAFQKIEIYSTKGFGNLMVIDGFVMLTERDNFIYHEMLTHPVLFSHLEPLDVVIVGGGDCGTLCEVAKHACVQTITQVEIDERVTQLAKQYFPALAVANNDPRVEFIFADAIQWMGKARDASIDVIIIDSTDPIGPAKGLFSSAFYKTCLQALRPSGLLVQQSESPLVHAQSIIKPMHAQMRKAGFGNTELLYFPQPSYPSGWWSATLANRDTRIAFAREQDAKESAIPTRYYNPAIHRASFATPQFLLKH